MFLLLRTTLHSKVRENIVRDLVESLLLFFLMLIDHSFFFFLFMSYTSLCLKNIFHLDVSSPRQWSECSFPCLSRVEGIQRNHPFKVSPVCKSLSSVWECINDLHIHLNRSVQWPRDERMQSSEGTRSAE